MRRHSYYGGDSQASIQGKKVFKRLRAEGWEHMLSKKRGVTHFRISGNGHTNGGDVLQTHGGYLHRMTTHRKEQK